MPSSQKLRLPSPRRSPPGALASHFILAEAAPGARHDSADAMITLTFITLFSLTIIYLTARGAITVSWHS